MAASAGTDDGPRDRADAGPHDRRLAVCYPTTDDTAVEATATHTHVDEWADMPRPDIVYQALEPTFTAPGCTSLIVTTGAGPANPSADYWRRCLADEGLHHPVFIPATARRTATTPGSTTSGGRCCRTRSQPSTH